MSRKNRLFAKLASTVNDNGRLQASSLSTDIDVGGVEGYNDTNALPANPSLGDLALVTSTNTLYVYNGSAWFNIAIANQAPTAITGNQASYLLTNDGTPTVVTLVSTDPEGFPLTWSATTSGDTQVGTVTNVDNVFTVTPSTNTNDSGLLNVTFSVTDGNNTETSISSFTLAFLSPLWDETVLSIGTSSTNGLDNSTFVDRSTNAHTVTATGTPIQTTFHPYLENWSFEGKQVSTNTGNAYEDQVWTSSATGTDFAFGTGDYTIEFWFKRTRTAAATEQMFQIGSGATGGPSVLWYNNNSLYFQRYPGSSNLFTAVDGAGLVPGCLDGKWHHFAGVRDNTGTSSHRFYIDGLFIKEVSTGDTDYVTNDNIVYIGDGQYGQFQGQISNVRVTKGAALYTGGSVMGDVVFTPPTEKLTTIVSSGTVVLLTGQSNRYIDNSASGHTLSARGENVKISAHNPFGQGSEYAAGENKGSTYFNKTNYLTYPQNNDWIFGTDDVTMEAWVYPIGTQGDQYTSRGLIYGKATGTGGYWFNEVFAVSTTDLLFTTNNYNGNSSASTVNASNVIKTEQWNHVVFTQYTIDGTRYWSLYCNGVREYHSTTTANLSISSTGWTHHTGFYPGNAVSFDYNGYISDLKISKSALYTSSSYTIPTSPLGNTSAYLYAPMDNTGIFDKTGNNTLTLAGNTSTSTIQTKFADTAMYFDGTGDSIIIEDNDLFDFGGSDFTIEMWLYNNSTSNMGIFGKRETNTQYGTTNLDINGGKIRFLISLNNGGWVSTNQTTFTVPSSQWYHLALVRDTSSSTLTCYANGNNVGQITSFIGSFVNTAYPFIVGNSVENTTEPPFNGYMENFQILKGVAKYTTNFTPPSRTQGRSYQAES